MVRGGMCDFLAVSANVAAAKGARERATPSPAKFGIRSRKQLHGYGKGIYLKAQDSSRAGSSSPIGGHSLGVMSAM